VIQQGSEHSLHAASDPDCPIETIPAALPYEDMEPWSVVASLGCGSRWAVSRKGQSTLLQEQVRWVTDPSAAKTQE